MLYDEHKQNESRLKQLRKDRKDRSFRRAIILSGISFTFLSFYYDFIIAVLIAIIGFILTYLFEMKQMCDEEKKLVRLKNKFIDEQKAVLESPVTFFDRCEHMNDRITHLMKDPKAVEAIARARESCHEWRDSFINSIQFHKIKPYDLSECMDIVYRDHMADTVTMSSTIDDKRLLNVSSYVYGFGLPYSAKMEDPYIYTMYTNFLIVTRAVSESEITDSFNKAFEDDNGLMILHHAKEVRDKNKLMVDAIPNAIRRISFMYNNDANILLRPYSFEVTLRWLRNNQDKTKLNLETFSVEEIKKIFTMAFLITQGWVPADFLCRPCALVMDVVGKKGKIHKINKPALTLINNSGEVNKQELNTD